MDAQKGVGTELPMLRFARNTFAFASVGPCCAGLFRRFSVQIARQRTEAFGPTLTERAAQMPNSSFVIDAHIDVHGTRHLCELFLSACVPYKRIRPRNAARSNVDQSTVFQLDNRVRVYLPNSE